MPRRGVATAACKKWNSKILAGKIDIKTAKNPKLGWFVGGLVAACGKMDKDAPESTKN